MSKAPAIGILFLIVALATCGPAAVFAQTAAQIEQAATETIEELDLQIELKQEDCFLCDLSLPELNLPGWVVWLALAIFVALLLYSIRDELPFLAFGRSQQWREGDGPDGSGEDSEEVLGEKTRAADDLAQEGQYVEAMHILLLCAFAEIRRRLSVNFSASLTSREILRRLKLPDTARHALDDIVKRVELSYFGVYPASAQDYVDCRSSFDTLIVALKNRQQPAEAVS